MDRKNNSSRSGGAYVGNAFARGSPNGDEAIGKRKFDDVLKEFAEDHDLDWTALQKSYNSKADRQALLDQISRTFASGIASTPTFIVNGQIMGFGPEGAFTIDAIRNAVGAPAPAKKTGK